MSKPLPTLLGLLATLVACSLALPALAAADPELPPGFQDEVVFSDLDQPTTFRFAPDGRVFVAEKSGKIVVFQNLQEKKPETFADLRTDVYDSGDRGLLGIALDPKFDEGRPYVYALYTYDHVLGDPSPPPKWGSPNDSGDPCPELNGGDACLVSGRLVRLEAEGNHAAPSAATPDQERLIEGWCQQFSSHSIGDLEFGPEGDLYVSGGDGASFSSADYGQFGNPTPNPCGDPPSPAGTPLSPPDAQGGSLRSQNLQLLNGKVLRVDPDTGEGVAGNPFASSGNQNTRRVIAEGFRNPFRLAFDPRTNEMYVANVGSSEIEEIDRFPTPPSGLFNSGWPCYEGPERQFQFKDLGLTVCEDLYGSEPSTSAPFFYYSHAQSVVPDDECSFQSGSAVGGMAFYEGSDYPSAYRGAFFFADSVRGCIWVMFPGDDGRPDSSTTIRFLREAKIYPGVDIEQGPEGNLFYADLFGDEEAGPGAIHRIVYRPGAPTAKLTATPLYGADLPLDVTYDASGSKDPPDNHLTYEWDMNGDGTFETTGGSVQSATYNDEENKNVAVRVTDDDGLSSVARVTVYPGDVPPSPEILEPQASFRWGAGDEIRLEGAATDGDGHGIFEPLRYYWATRLLHCPTGPTNCHPHPLQVFSGVMGGEFTVPEHDYPSFVEITLRVSDSRGLVGSKTLKIEPRTVQLGVSSDPPGIELTAGLVRGLAPFTQTTIEGNHVLLSAPESWTVNGNTYTFDRWSDGGARSHVVLASSDAQYRAFFTAPEGGGGGDGGGDGSGGSAPGGGAGSVGTSPSGSHSGQKPSPRMTRPKLRRRPAQRTRRHFARFVFATPGARYYQCRIDRRKFASCHSPRTYRHLKRGVHRFRVRVVNGRGKPLSKARFYRWRILPRSAIRNSHARLAAPHAS